jgi:hypothetical protein
MRCTPVRHSLICSLLGWTGELAGNWLKLGYSEQLPKHTKWVRYLRARHAGCVLKHTPCA